jgi:hypothetical protein
MPVDKLLSISQNPSTVRTATEIESTWKRLGFRYIWLVLDGPDGPDEVDAAFR